jgi:hypothetical protein
VGDTLGKNRAYVMLIVMHGLEPLKLNFLGDCMGIRVKGEVELRSVYRRAVLAALFAICCLFPY